MVKYQVCHMFKPKNLMDYKVMKIINESTLLLVTPNGIEYISNINDIKPTSLIELLENSRDSFLNSIKTNHLNHDYNLKPHS